MEDEDAVEKKTFVRNGRHSRGIYIPMYTLSLSATENKKWHIPEGKSAAFSLRENMIPFRNRTLIERLFITSPYRKNIPRDLWAPEGWEKF